MNFYLIRSEKYLNTIYTWEYFFTSMYDFNVKFYLMSLEKRLVTYCTWKCLCDLQEPVGANSSLLASFSSFVGAIYTSRSQLAPILTCWRHLVLLSAHFRPFLLAHFSPSLLAPFRPQGASWLHLDLKESVGNNSNVLASFSPFIGAF